MSLSLKEVTIRPLVGKKKANLDPKDLGIFQPVSNLPFWGTVIKCVVAKQLQQFWDKADRLDYFESGFRSGT